MKIVKLTAENFKRLVAVEITPTGDVVTITGKNGAGKTSVLDAIMVALGGTKNAPEKPIRTGEDSAKVVIDLGDYIVTRTWKGENSYLKITLPDKSPIAKPQDLLNSLLGKFTFDPAEFMSVKPEIRREILLGLVPLAMDGNAWKEITGEAWLPPATSSELLACVDGKRKELFMQRTSVGRDVDRTFGALEKAKESMPVASPRGKISIRETTDALSEANEKNAVRDKKATELDAINNEFYKEESRLAKLRKEAEEIKASMNSLKAASEKAKAELDAMPDFIDTDELTAKINIAGEINREVDLWESKTAEIEKLQTTHNALKEEQQILTNKIKALDIIKDGMLAKAKMPIVGLTVEEGDVFYKSIPFSQCSHSERLRISMCIGMALNPDIRVMRVTDGEKFDSKAWAVIEKLASAHDFQVWIEKMDESGEVGVFIEDGATR